MKVEQVEVQMITDPNDMRRHLIRVWVDARVTSILSRLPVHTYNDVDPGKAANAQKLQDMVGIAAAAIAEHQAEKYKARLDPAEAYKQACEAFRGEMAEYAKKKVH